MIEEKVGKMKRDLFREFGVFKCLGCEYYLSGRYTDSDGNYRSCKTHCPRTEDGIEQILCRIQNIKGSIQTKEREIKELVKKKDKLTEMINNTQDSV